jgi:hypothetical protein
MKKETCLGFRGFGLILSCFFFAAAAGIFAQESSGDGFGARVYHAEGADFILTAGEQRYIHRPGSLGEAGLVLNSRDMIQTGADSFVEIQLTPGGTVIKAAENTSFVFNGPGRDGASVSFTLLYGRIRVVRGPGEGNRDVMVQAPNAAVFIRRGDIGLDYILRPGLSLTGSGVTTPLLRTFGFSGAADLVPLVIGERNGGAAGGEAAFIRVSEGETLALEVFSGFSFTERKALERDIVEYWIRNDFKGTPPLKIPDTLPALASHRPQEPSEPANQIQYTLPDYGAIKKLRQVKNGGIAAGILFSIVGIGIQGFGAYQRRAGNHDSARLLIDAGYGPLGLGIVTLMMTLAANPSNPAEYGAP